jgi:hypothetical protein
VLLGSSRRAAPLLTKRSVEASVLSGLRPMRGSSGLLSERNDVLNRTSSVWACILFIDDQDNMGV